MPVLGAVPESPCYSTAGSRFLPVEAEVFALLRARLRYFNVDRDVRSLLVTSAIPGEGKTTVALNLALAEAVAGNTRVVLVEADLRRPALRQRLAMEARPGLAEILSRNATIDDALAPAQVPGRGNGNGPPAGVAIISAGAIPPNPGQLVESRAMIELLDTLSEQFDLVILDPPTSVVSDAIPLMRLVSGVVIVSRIGVTAGRSTTPSRTLAQAEGPDSWSDCQRGAPQEPRVLQATDTAITPGRTSPAKPGMRSQRFQRIQRALRLPNTGPSRRCTRRSSCPRLQLPSSKPTVQSEGGNQNDGGLTPRCRNK